MVAGWRKWFPGLLIVAALTGMVLHFSELRKFSALLRQMEPGWLAIALVLQLSTYVSLALGWHAVLQQAEQRSFGLGPLIRIALCKLFADQALPTAGMGGNVLLVDQLVGIGARRGTAVAALMVTLQGYYAAYLCYALAALFLLWLHGHATPLMAGLVTCFVLVAIAIPALALWLRGRGSKPLPPMIEGIGPIRQLIEIMAEAPLALVQNRTLFVKLLCLNGLIFAADIMTLFACLRGLGVSVTPSTAMIAFILASIAATLGPIPFGLGSFELVCASTLHLLGIGLEAAIAATLVLRVFILWLPLVPGLILTRRMMGRGSGDGHSKLRE